MTQINIDTNIVNLCGELVRDKYNKLYNNATNYYTSFIKVDRQSKQSDILPIKLSSRIITIEELEALENKKIYLEGKGLSFEKQSDGRNKRIITIGVDKITDQIPEDVETNNYVEIQGKIIKKPVFRITPLGRYITELTIESVINNNYKATLPCICWSKLAINVAEYNPEDRVTVIGRFQSRSYVKKNDINKMEKITYEISASNIIKE